MALNNELFELVKSLSKTEKRYIRLYSAQQKGSKLYISLFDAIDKTNGIDEKEFRKRNSNERFMKHYSFNKHYLYTLIIKCLSSYVSERSVDAKIHSMIMQCKILFNKALYRQYFRSIEKAKKFALKHERFGYYLQILDMEKIIIKKEEVQGEKSEQLYSEARMAIENLSDIFELSRLSARAINISRRHGIIRNPQQDTQINEILGHPALNSPGRLCSRAKESYYRVHEIINDIRAAYPQKKQAQVNRYNLVHSDPFPFRDYIIDFEKDVVLSLIESLIDMGMLDDAERYLHNYKKLSHKNNADIEDYEVMPALAEFQISLKRNDFEAAGKLTPLLERLLIKYENKLLIDVELTIRYNILKLFILTAQYKKALKSVNILMAHPFLEKRSDYESYVRILNLVIHFELGNFELLKYLLVSTYRFLYKRKKLYRLEMLVLEFIRSLPGVKNNEDLTFGFKQLNKKLEELKADNYEKNAFEYFDFQKWVKDKI